MLWPNFYKVISIKSSYHHSLSPLTTSKSFSTKYSEVRTQAFFKKQLQNNENTKQKQVLSYQLALSMLVFPNNAHGVSYTLCQIPFLYII